MANRLRSTLQVLVPHGVLVVAAALEVVLEAVRIESGSTIPLVLAAVVVLTALAFVWRHQDQLRFVPVVLIGVSLQLTLIAVHLLLGSTGDQDPRIAYSDDGRELLHGSYPESEYPVGAVLLFGFEALLGGGSAETPNRFLMVPFQLLCVVAVWSLRTRYSRWFAALIAIWPMNAYYWQYRFDLVPAALIVLGLLLAYRGRWGWSGLTLGVGAAVKWSPALSFAVLAVWLAATRRWRDAWHATAAFVTTVVLIHLPFVLWNPGHVLAAYTNQGGRTITNESLWFFPLSLAGLTHLEPRVWAPAGSPHEADVAASAIQTFLLVGLLVLATLARGRPRPALVLAALAPVVFLLTNKIFSPQFLVVVTVALAFAGALAVTRRSEQLLLGLLLMVATFANAFVYPYEIPFGVVTWRPLSAAVFAAAILATVVILRRAVAMIGVREGTALTQSTTDEPGDLGFAGVLRTGRDRLNALLERPPVTPLPAWIARALRWLTAGLVVVFAVPVVFVASVLPYRFWDSLAFGSWSSSIAETGSIWANAGELQLSRPVFYIPQGVAWRILGEEAWIGRVLSASFGVLLVVAVWGLAGRLTTDRAGTQVLRALAVGLILGSALFATYVAAGMTDVPVAAFAAATGALVWSAPRRWPLLLAALCATATVLSKPSGLLALAGLVLAALVLHRRRALPGIAAVAAGIGVALIYSAWQASRVGDSLVAFLSAGNESYWRERGAAARWDALARAEWLGAGVRLLVLFGLVHAVARIAGARPRTALAAAAAVAIMWSVAGPLIADGKAPYPFDGSVLGLVAWLALAAAMIAAPWLAAEDPIGRRTYGALILWLAPTAIAWAWWRADEVRHLAPGWAPLVLLGAAALTSLSLALARLRPAATLVPAAAVAVLVVANLPSIDGLGREGWRGLLELGPSGWRSQASVENYAYGPFSYELNLARENVGSIGRVVSSDGRLSYFFPGRVEVAYPRTCAELQGSRFFTLLTSGESLVLAAREGQPVDPLGWLQCRRPHVEMVGEQQGIYAAYVVGKPPARAPTPEDCHIESYPGQLSDAVFGDGLTYATAKALRERAAGFGFQGAGIERTGCSTFRVVITGVPPEKTVQADFRREVESVGLQVSFVQAARYPPAPPEVAAVR